MAWGNSNYNQGKKKSKYSDLERLAYNMGKVSCGRQNQNSKVYESYQAGLKCKETPAKKPMI